MKKTSLLLAVCAATTLLAQTVLADSSTMRVSKFLGANVRDMAGQSVGTLKDIVMQPSSGQAEFAIISLNDRRDQLTAVPWKLIQPTTDPATVTLNVDRSKLLSATTFDSDHWPTFDTTYDQRIYTYYGVQYPAGVAVGGYVGGLQGEYGSPVITKEYKGFPRPQPDGHETFPELNRSQKDSNSR